MVYRRTERIEARLAEDRERVLVAARDVVREVGFGGAKMAMVAASAGVATGSVYRHFPSKGALFSEMLREVCARELAVVQEVASSEGSATARISDAVEVFSARCLRSGGLAYAVVVEPMDPEVNQVRLHARRDLARLFSALVEEGMASGELPHQSPVLAGAAIVGTMLEGLATPLEDGAVDPGALCAGLRVFCLRGVGASSAS